MITSINGLEYGGKYNKYFWDVNVNPLATISNCLANCTTFVIGDVLSDKLPMPISMLRNANSWHNYVTNGWTVHDFDYNSVQVGDILEWTSGCHVARVTKIKNSQVYVSGSFYTGIHGRAYYGGGFDTRDGLNSLQEVSDFMIKNYPVRFFHFWELEEENRWVGYSPRYILRPPTQTVTPVDRNELVDQIQVLTNEQNVRDKDNNILGFAKKGWYNVLSTIDKNGYTWCEVEENKYIALIPDRVIYYQASSEIEKLKEENKQLKADMQKIYKIIERWLG